MKKLISIWLLIVISGCSVKYHEKAFFKKGGKFECEPRVISTIDTLITERGDTILKVVYKTIYEPKIEYKTKWQTRFDNKRFKDSLSVMKKMYSDSLKYAFKAQKSIDKKETKLIKFKEKTNRTQIRKENKNKWWYWLIIGMPIGVIIYKLVQILTRKIKI